ncbi:unnamed protein product [Paramecium octaurelia]|uniref:Protein kinase domain-containing protein n=1 Tax=Paramecium octaurelia TaxID=43137 RepID=A0A8S1S9U2_PAROT|nr:unnamed protein product [Paramecium octaurelia]
MMLQNDKIVTILHRQLKILNLLGKGNFGTVWKVVDEKTKEIFALKIQSQLDEHEQEILVNLSQFSHRNIVNILGFEKINDQCFCILMECCSENLFERIQSKVFDQKDLRYVLVSIADGIKALHNNTITHRDLKPENIMIKVIKDSKNPGYTQNIYKIGDFGLSSNKDVNQTSQVGTCYYMAPEVISNQPYTNSVDIWSLGAISYELLTNRPLFEGNSQDDILTQIINFNTKEVYDVFLKKIEIIQEDEYQSLIKKMLQYNPQNRINIDEVVRQLRNRYSSPPKIMPLFQPKIETPKIFQQQLTYGQNQTNKMQIQLLFEKNKFSTPKLEQQNNNDKSQQAFPQKVQQNVSGFQLQQTTINQQSSLQSPRDGKQGQISWNTNQASNIINSPHSPQRLNNFNIAPKNGEFKKPDNQAKPVFQNIQKKK